MKWFCMRSIHICLSIKQCLYPILHLCKEQTLMLLLLNVHSSSIISIIKFIVLWLRDKKQNKTKKATDNCITRPHNHSTKSCFSIFSGSHSCFHIRICSNAKCVLRFSSKKKKRKSNLNGRIWSPRSEQRTKAMAEEGKRNH